MKNYRLHNAIVNLAYFKSAYIHNATLYIKLNDSGIIYHTFNTIEEAREELNKIEAALQGVNPPQKD